MGQFSKAREVFEEALASLTSVKDFGVIFNAYLKFEEAMLEVPETAMDQDDSQDDSESDEESLADQVDALLDWTFRDVPEKQQAEGDDSEPKFKSFTKEEKEELKFVRLENLI